MFVAEYINNRNRPYKLLLFPYACQHKKPSAIHFNLIDMSDLVFICVTMIKMINTNRKVLLYQTIENMFMVFLLIIICVHL